MALNIKLSNNLNSSIRNNYTVNSMNSNVHPGLNGGNSSVNPKLTGGNSNVSPNLNGGNSGGNSNLTGSSSNLNGLNLSNKEELYSFALDYYTKTDEYNKLDNTKLQKDAENLLNQNDREYYYYLHGNINIRLHMVEDKIKEGGISDLTSIIGEIPFEERLFSDEINDLRMDYLHIRNEIDKFYKSDTTLSEEDFNNILALMEEGDEKLQRLGELIYIKKYYMNYARQIVIADSYNLSERIETVEKKTLENIEVARPQLEELYNDMLAAQQKWVKDNTYTIFGNSFKAALSSPIENLADGITMFLGQTGAISQSTAQSFIQRNLVFEIYSDFLRESGVMNQDLILLTTQTRAYTIGNFSGALVGNVMFYATVGNLANVLGPAGFVLRASISYLTGSGSAAEQAFNSGATFSEASTISTLAGLTSVFVDMFQSTNKTINNNVITSNSVFKNILKYSKDAGIGAIEPFVNSLLQYTIAKDQQTQSGEKVYNNFWDYYEKSGGVRTTLTAIGVAGFTSILGDLLPKVMSKMKLKNALKNLDVDDFGNLNKIASKITNEADFKIWGDKLGYSIETLDMYIAQLKSDLSWDSKEILRKNILDGNYSDAKLKNMGVEDIDFFKTLEIDDQRKSIKFTNKFVDTEYNRIKNADYKAKIAASAETLLATQQKASAGYYDISANEVIIKRMEARKFWDTGGKEGKLTSSKEILITDKKGNIHNYTEYFPGCDDFISDSALINYTQKITNISDETLTSFAKDNNLDLKTTQDKLIVLGEYLKNNKKTVKGKIFQNAKPRESNFVTFKNNLGDLRQVEGKYNTTGGAYMLMSNNETMAKNFSKYCKLDENGNLKITNMQKFGQKALSGVPLGVDGVYMFDCVIELNSKNISLPSINNKSMYTAYGVPGGELLSGELETVISGTFLGDKMNTNIRNGYMGELSIPQKTIKGYFIREVK